VRVSPSWRTVLIALIALSVLEWMAGLSPLAWRSWSHRQIVVYLLAFVVVIVLAFVRREYR